MTTEDVQTIARIVVNQNFAMMEARLKSVEELMESWPDWDARRFLRMEANVLRGQIDEYNRQRAAQAKS